MEYYQKGVKETLEQIESSVEGLSSSQAQERLDNNGKNKLVQAKKISTFQRFTNQLKDPMIIVLLVAALISAITAIYTHEGFADVIIILFVVLLNAILGVVQESKAEQAIEALNEMAASTAKVLRDHQLIVIKSEDLVIGDVIILEAGDAVSADARLIEIASLKVEEATLTGESVPVSKELEFATANKLQSIPLGDRLNMVYMGSSIAYGRGKAVVVATGMQTEMGKIADVLAQTDDGKTPLQLKLHQLSKILTWIVLGICIFIFIFSVVRSGQYQTQVILDSFLIAVSLAVAAIPEGLATVVTIVLSIGVTKMSKRHAIIRKLTAVETLGCTQVICSDKTGTLTQNKMTVVTTSGEDTRQIAQAMALCSDAQLDSNFKAFGEPTECALVNYAYTLGLNKNQLASQFPRVDEAPFDSIRKLMTVICQDDHQFIQYTKGAPDELLKSCKYIEIHGRIEELSKQQLAEILATNKKMADQALRVLAVAKRIYNDQPATHQPEDLETGLIFLGLAGMIDPVREEVALAIQLCKNASIQPIMITGDHLDTAIAIAKQLNIINDVSQAITGATLDTISDEDFKTKVKDFAVYARVQPEHKVRIVNAWRNNGFITAMTGDGVNDAPSIKIADIGVGMGITGTDVTKNVADMVLTDDNFATIVVAVEEGRRIYDNIRKAIQFLLSSNLSEVLAIFVATMLGFTILHPVHILWINLITDTLPALALGMEEAEKDIMDRHPRNPKESVFAGGLGVDVVYQGIIVAILTLFAYFIGHFMESGLWEITNSQAGITMAFLTMSMTEIFHSFNLRSQIKSVFSLSKTNWYLFGAMLLSLILTTMVIYVPFLAKAFGLRVITWQEYLVALVIAVSIIPIVEIVKLVRRSLDKGQ